MNKIDFKITTETLITETDFLDIKLNLTDNINKPYSKPNNNTICINRHSNHPKYVIKSLPSNINKRTIALSKNKNCYIVLLL